jgi:GNAT superfamily N-acetyltransferase
MIGFAPLEREDMPIIVAERAMIPETLRTPYFVNGDMQNDYYESVLCNRSSTTRYFKFLDNTDFIGMGGIENISFENSIGELSVLIFSTYRGHGYGKRLVYQILDYAFRYLNLENVFAECYLCGNIEFWNKIQQETSATYTYLESRKFYNGQYYSSMYINFNRTKDGPTCKKFLSQEELGQ